MNFARGCIRVIVPLAGLWFLACLALLWFAR
jgi:hypothetical protein